MPDPPPRRSRLRARLAIGTTLTALGVAALVAIGAAALSAWRAHDPSVETQAGAARVGDDVAVVVVADGAGAADAAADARADALRWTLVALGVALVPAVVIGWFTAGRLLGSVDRALADIERADEDRAQRLHEVAHELRTPLAVMTVNLELAAARGRGDDDLSTWIDASRRACERLTTTVSDLAGHGALGTAPARGRVDLATEARALVTEHAGPAHRRGVRCAVVGDGPLAVPAADRPSVRTALGNLIDNAVGLAPGSSAVTIDWGRLDDWAWVSVADEGPGLAARHHARVFERGWSARPAGGDDGPPRGLGLAIARQLAEADRGALTVESAPGGGTVFALWLPLTPTATRAAVVARDGVHPAATPWRAKRSSSLTTV